MEQQLNEHNELREQLDSLLRQARLNQEKMQRINQQELLLIGITSLQGFLDHLLYHLPQAFELDALSLLLIDPDREIFHLLELDEIPAFEIGGLMVEEDDALVRQHYSDQLLPQLSSYQAARHQLFFPSAQDELNSVAFLPLVRSGKLIGSLHFASRHQGRFNPDSATDFLQRLAAITAVCLENCLNHARLQRIGLTDPLTGINNRRYFERRLTEASASSLRHERPLACLFIDVDHFKRINDEWGHLVGDTVLRRIAQQLAGQLRHSDVLCRYGGEEFVVLLPDTPRDEAGKIAERIRRSIEVSSFEIPAAVTVSLGVALLEQFADSELSIVSEQLVAAADAALYLAKERGRNGVVMSGE